MPLSLTCSCGAKLEIDDKFAGQTIPCPDCHRQLSTKPAPIKAERTSAFALAGLLLAVVGAFSVIGPLVAIGCGLIGLRHIAKHPEKVGGRRYALAGIYLGGAFLALGLILHLLPDVLGLDSLFRELEWANRLEYRPELLIDNKDSDSAPIKFSFTRPSRSWGKLVTTSAHQRVTSDLILINPWEDAQIACMNWDQERHVDDESLPEESVDFFLKSELVQAVGRAPKTVPKPSAERKLETPKESRMFETQVDVKLGGIDRTYLVRAIRTKDVPPKTAILAAGTRKSRFRRLEPELRKALDGYALSP